MLNHHLVTSKQESVLIKDSFFSVNFLNGLHCASIVQLRTCGVN